MRYRLDLSYDGSAFFGWQIQPEVRTVQGCVESALSTLLKFKAEVVGAGRTDTGVNASCYVAHFDAPEGTAVDCADLKYRLNAILPKEISISSVAPVSEEFHARFSAKRRDYSYFLHTGKDAFVDKYSYFCPVPLDIEAMNEAASHLLGTKDFSCFEKVGADNKTSICTVVEAAWKEYRPSVCSAGEGARYFVFHIAADRFLRNMVRAIVGTLIEVGRGKRTPDSVVQLLETRSRCAAGESVPGKALFLDNIEY